MCLGEGSYPLAITRANLAPSGVGLSNLITVQVNCLRLQVPTTVPVRVNAFEYGVVIVTFILVPVGYGRRMNLNSPIHHSSPFLNFAKIGCPGEPGSSSLTT